jgi:hypothetical protein
MVNAFSSIPQPTFPPPSLNTKPAGGNPPVAPSGMGAAVGGAGNIVPQPVASMATPVMAQAPQVAQQDVVPAVPKASGSSLRETPQFGSKPSGTNGTGSGAGGKKIQLFGQKIALSYVLGGLFFVLMAIGLGTGFYLSQQKQDVRQQASNGCINDQCYGGGSDNDPQKIVRSCEGSDSISGSTCTCYGVTGLSVDKPFTYPVGGTRPSECKEAPAADGGQCYGACSADQCRATCGSSVCTCSASCVNARADQGGNCGGTKVVSCPSGSSVDGSQCSCYNPNDQKINFAAGGSLPTECRDKTVVTTNTDTCSPSGVCNSSQCTAKCTNTYDCVCSAQCAKASAGPGGTCGGFATSSPAGSTKWACPSGSSQSGTTPGWCACNATGTTAIYTFFSYSGAAADLPSVCRSGGTGGPAGNAGSGSPTTQPGPAGPSAPAISSGPTESTDLCGDQAPVNTQFRVADPTNKAAWIDGAAMTNAKLKVGQKIDVTCFAKNGTSTLLGGYIEVSVPGATQVEQASAQPTLSNYELKKDGMYTFVCKSGQKTSCSNSDFFTVEISDTANPANPANNSNTTGTSGGSNSTTVDSNTRSTTPGGTIPVSGSTDTTIALVVAGAFFMLGGKLIYDRQRQQSL